MTPGLLSWCSTLPFRQDTGKLPMTSETRGHNRVAMNIARRYGARFNTRSNPDIETPDRVIEVESAATVAEGFQRLRNFRKPVYIAGADVDAVTAACKATIGTTVGVMTPDGKIVKRSTRGWLSALMEKFRGPERMREVSQLRN